MAKRLNPKWEQGWTEKILAYVPEESEKLELVTDSSLAKTWLVLKLTREGIPFAVHTLGAGVSKITTDTGLCSKCKGTGRVPVKGE